MRRIAIGGILHETNTFAPLNTPLAAFVEQNYYTGNALIDHMRGTPTAFGGVLDGLQKAGYTPVPLLYATAMPSGMVDRVAFDTMLAEIMQRLSTMLPVDGVLLTLHGAMVAEQSDDCEGEILSQVRAAIGPECPLVTTLDMHGNLSETMVEMADALVAFDTNPHMDGYDRGQEAVRILQRMLEEGIRTTHHLTKPPLLLSALTTWTARAPLYQIHRQAAEFERNPHVVNISIMGGFAYADTPYSGLSLLVTTDGDQALARKLAGDLATTAWEQREAAFYTGLPVHEAIERAARATGGPVVLADVGDNIGGGSPGDGTVLLQALLTAQILDSVVIIADPESVAQAIQAGQGRMVNLTVGGKHDHLHGEPVPVQGMVERLTDGRYRIEGSDHFAQLYGREVEMGRCAVVNSGGVRMLLTERKTPPGNLAQLRSQGIMPEAQRAIVAKSAVAFRGAYEQIAGEIYEVDTPGICASDLRRFSYHKIPRPILPLDQADHDPRV